MPVKNIGPILGSLNFSEERCYKKLYFAESGGGDPGFEISRSEAILAGSTHTTSSLKWDFYASVFNELKLGLGKS